MHHTVFAVMINYDTIFQLKYYLILNTIPKALSTCISNFVYVCNLCFRSRQNTNTQKIKARIDTQSSGFEFYFLFN